MWGVPPCPTPLLWPSECRTSCPAEALVVQLLCVTTRNLGSLGVQQACPQSLARTWRILTDPEFPEAPDVRKTGPVCTPGCNLGGSRFPAQLCPGTRTTGPGLKMTVECSNISGNSEDTSSKRPCFAPDSVHPKKDSLNVSKYVDTRNFAGPSVGPPAA